MSMATVKIKSIGKVVTGKTPPTGKREYFDGQYPFITPSDIDDYKIRRVRKAERTLSERWKIKAPNYLLPSNTICYVCIGSTVGKSCLTNEESFSNQQINALVCDEEKVNHVFIFYLLKNKTPEIKKIADSSGVGKGIINKTSFENFNIEIPDLSTQSRVASVLSAYDDLIENNEKRIKILEEMAQRLYTEWFVKFKFPGHEKTRMVSVETHGHASLQKIPEGWEVGRLSDIFENLRIATQSGSHLTSRRYVPIDCIPRKNLALRESNRWEDAQSSLILFERGDVLFGAMRPYFHKVAIAPFAGITRTTCFVLRPKFEYLRSFGTLLAYSDGVVAFASGHTKGATIPYAVWENSLSDYKVVIPHERLLKAFEEIVAGSLNALVELAQFNNVLIKMRDSLIPQLVTGKRKLK